MTLGIYRSCSNLWNGKNNFALTRMNSGLQTVLGQNQDGLPCY